MVAVSSGFAGTAVAGEWTAPEQITANGFSPQADIGPDGTSAVVWVPQHRGEFGGRGLRFAVRSPDGTYGPHQDLFTDDAYDQERMWFPWADVAVAGDGTASVAWYTGGTIRVATAGPGGVLGPAQVLATGVRVPSFSLAAGPVETIVTWAEENEARMAVRVGPLFGPEQPSSGIPLTIDAAGVATVLRQTFEPNRVGFSRRPPGGTFAPAQWAPGDLPGWFPRVLGLSGNRDGSMAVLFETSNERSSHDQWVVTAPGGGVPRGPFAVDPAVQGGETWHGSSGSGAIGSGPDGSALIAMEFFTWDSNSGRSTGLQLQPVGTDGLPRAPALVPGIGSSHVPRVGFDTSGAAVAVTSSMQGTVSVTVPDLAKPPCPYTQITRNGSIPMPPVLDRGPVGLIAWQQVPSTASFVVFHRAVDGCPGGAPGGGTPDESIGDGVGGSANNERADSDRQDRAGSPSTGAVPAGGGVLSPPLGAPLPPRASVGPAGSARIARTAAVDRSLRRAMLRLACPAGAPCAGRVELLSFRSARAARLGAAPYSLAAGATRAVRVPLSATARRSLRRARTLRVRVRLIETTGTPREVVLTLRR